MPPSKKPTQKKPQEYGGPESKVTPRDEAVKKLLVLVGGAIAVVFLVFFILSFLPGKANPNESQVRLLPIRETQQTLTIL